MCRIPRARDYADERETRASQRSEVGDAHPLYVDEEALASKRAKPKVVGLDMESVADPLSGGASTLTGLDDDPLKAMQVNRDRDREFYHDEVVAAARAGTDTIDNGFVPWEARKAGILATYTTSESLTITTSFLASQARVPQDKVAARLEELGGEDEMQELANLSQKEYVNHIDTLNKKLVAAWEADERVKSLKIAIQAAKLLSDTTPVRFYPSKFTLVTEILDSFGNLVFDRILEKAEELAGKKIGTSFKAEQIEAAAKETCRNWFYKIASIRELLPRLYIEISIMRCYQFMQDGAYPEALRRLSKMLRGIGDPLVAIYARTYLTRRGYQVAPEIKDYVISGFQDVLFTCGQVSSKHFESDLQARMLTLQSYYELFSPALDWLLSCIAYRSPQTIYDLIIGMYEQHPPVALVLHHIMQSLSPEYISQHALQFVKLISSADETFARSKLYRKLGISLMLSPPAERHHLSILNDVWSVVTAIKDPAAYMEVAEVFIEFPVKHCQPSDVNRMLADVLAHVNDEARSYEKLAAQLASMMGKVLAHMHDFCVLFSMPNFMPVVDLFDGQVGVDVCKLILSTFARYQDATFDPVVVNGMFYVGKVVHDSVNALTFEDESRQIAKLLVAFVRKINFGRKFEAHLNFLVECRQAFVNLDAVVEALVLAANDLAMQALRMAGGKHSRKTGSFARACLAYCFITIPSIANVFTRLKLYLHCGQGAMLNNCLSQADSFFKTAITVCPEVPVLAELSNSIQATGPWFVEYLRQLTAALVCIPGHPQKGPFHLLMGLLTVVHRHEWEKNTDYQATVYMHMLPLFAAYAQDEPPYRFANVVTNEKLYGGDPAYFVEIATILNQLCDEVFKHLASLSNAPEPAVKRRQAQLAADFLNVLVSHFSFTPKMCSVALNLYRLAAAGLPANGQGYLKATLEHVRQRMDSGDQDEQEAAAALYARMASSGRAE